MKTSFISAYNLEALAQTNGTHEITVNTSKEFYALHDYLVFTLGWDCYEYAHVSQDGSVTINIRVSNNQPEPTNPDNTPSTMNANEINAPEFSELSHTATNIVLTAENDGNIYRRHVQPLILSLVNKIKRGIKPDRKRLAQSAAMRTIIANSLAEMYCAGWMEDNTRVKATERKEAANYLAWSYISDAEDEYNNQMAAYK